MPANESTLIASRETLPIRHHRQPLTHASVVTAYQRLAPVYDWMFGACFRAGQRKAVESLASGPGDRILEVGVGTGLALRHWHRESKVTGIDISERMLHRAMKVRHRHGLHNVDLRLMDAQSTGFPDNHFDKVAAMYVVSVVPNPPALLREMRRICKPGGKIAIVNHFAHPNPTVNRMEQRLANYAGLLGFNTALPIDQVTKSEGLRVHRLQPVNWGGYWTLIEAENIK